MTDTDPVPEEPMQVQYGFLARLIGLPILEERLLDAIEQLIGTSEADKQALVAAAASLRNTDVTIDNIEPVPLTKKGPKP